MWTPKEAPLVQKPRSLEKPVSRALFRLAVFFALLACAFGVYVSVRIAKADRFYAYRYNDTDHDTVPDCQDDDVDGDTIPNMQDSDADGNDVENWMQATQEALKLVGLHTDPFKGAFHNLGVRMGFFRSADVVLIAYEKAGLYLAPEIEKDALTAPDEYALVMRGGKVDVHDARALDVFCERRNWRRVTWRVAQKGDAIFFGHDLVGLVVDYQEPEGYVVVLADPDTGKVVRASTTQLESNGHSPSAAAFMGQ